LNQLLLKPLLSRQTELLWDVLIWRWVYLLHRWDVRNICWLHLCFPCLFNPLYSPNRLNFKVKLLEFSFVSFILLPQLKVLHLKLFNQLFQRRNLGVLYLEHYVLLLLVLEHQGDALLFGLQQVFQLLHFRNFGWQLLENTRLKLVAARRFLYEYLLVGKSLLEKQVFLFEFLLLLHHLWGLYQLSILDYCSQFLLRPLRSPLRTFCGINFSAFVCRSFWRRRLRILDVLYC
jgi:hypothetical protein